MIIAMFGLNRDLEVGETRYENISLVSWRCWCKFFRWLYEQNDATLSLFQDGWAAEIKEV